MFLQKDQAIGHAEARAWFRKGEIRILDSPGKIENLCSFG